MHFPISRRAFIAGAAATAALPALERTPLASPLRPASILTSSGQQIRGWNLPSSDLGGSGVDRPFSASADAPAMYDQAGSDEAIDQIAALGCNACALQMEWGFDAAHMFVYGKSETRAGVIRAAKRIVTKGLDLWIKGNHWPSDGSNRGLFTPRNPASWFADLQALTFQLCDAVEASLASLPGSPHIWGYVLTSELNALTVGYESYWQSLYNAMKARYPTMRVVCNMPMIQFVGDRDQPGFAGASRAYHGVFDILCLDTYIPVAVPGESSFTEQQAFDRLGTPGMAHGGNRNYVGRFFAGSSFVDYMNTFSATYNKYWATFEMGSPACAPIIETGVQECGEGNATAAGLANQAAYDGGMVRAIYQPRLFDPADPRKGGAGGAMFWAKEPVHDAITPYYGTADWDWGQKRTLIDQLTRPFPSGFGGSYALPAGTRWIPGS